MTEQEMRESYQEYAKQFKADYPEPEIKVITEKEYIEGQAQNEEDRKRAGLA